mgnify:FL=1
MHKFDNLLSAIVLRRYVLTRFMVEKLRSALAEETGIVRWESNLQMLLSPEMHISFLQFMRHVQVWQQVNGLHENKKCCFIRGC